MLYNLQKVMKTLKGYKSHELCVINDGIFRHLEVENVAAGSLDKVKQNVDDYFSFLSKEKKEAADSPVYASERASTFRLEM